MRERVSTWWMPSLALLPDSPRTMSAQTGAAHEGQSGVSAASISAQTYRHTGTGEAKEDRVAGARHLLRRSTTAACMHA